MSCDHRTIGRAGIGGAGWRLLAALLISVAVAAAGDDDRPRTVLVVYEPGPSPVASGLGDARQLRQLLGHFRTDVTLEPADQYKPETLRRFDVAFFVGYTRSYNPPLPFLRDVYADRATFVWLNSGLAEFGRTFDLASRFGFLAQGFDTTSTFDSVQADDHRFTKTEPNANIIKVVDDSQCQVLATTSSSKSKLTVPYAVRSGSFWCLADSPFSYATEADRYLYFADTLHDILGEDHPRSHSALIRIEDTNPFSDPASLRAIADLLSSRRIPFLVGVIPIYVNPATQTRVAMSEKPDYVDALHYAMEHGGTIVLHGTTHQYKGESASDYEYWDESRNRVLPMDSREYVARKLRDGIVECVKNGVYPLVWETPHYSASTLDYTVFGEHFSTAMEQRLVVDNLDYSQYFPYLIKRDMYGQRILPENLGYIPLDPDPAKEQQYVDTLLSFARTNLAVRDGFVSAFFHPFVKIEFLAHLVDGIRDLGYTFVDAREMTNTVQMDDRAIASGDATVKVTLADQYLRESWLDADGQVVRREVSATRLHGQVQREVKLPPRWIYVAEPREYRERTPSIWEKARNRASALLAKVARGEEPHRPADALFLYDPQATGGAANDQQSLVAPFVALNIPVDQVPLTSNLDIEPGEHNLVIVPYTIAEELTAAQVEKIKAFLAGGGDLITDFRNDLAAALGVRFLESTILVERVRDRLFPDESLHWKTGEVMNKFETTDDDEVLATDEVTEMPVVIGRRYGHGRFILFGTRFDPTSTGGYSRYPYLAHYVEHFFGLTPLVRRDQLEMYFDPGYRHTVSIEQLVPRWAAAGIRILHVGGWHEYAKWTYDYRRLISLCHANGILVYCWIEPPQVSEKFWHDHPEWREKNYKGEDVRPTWRYPVALTDPACLAAAVEFYRKLLVSQDWDGVNIGELCFEAGRGMKDPQLYTPMHPTARSEFRRQSGFDPVELFDPASPRFWRRDPAALAAFGRYRLAKVLQLHETFLAMVDAVAKGKPGFQEVVTVYDSVAVPEMRAWLGVDARQIATLAEKYLFNLQVEDPDSLWSTDPRRYEAMAARYAGLVKPDRLALDLNILSFRAENAITPFPTRIQTGTEAAWLVNSAARGARRVAIYSESSINQQDLAYLPAAYAARTAVAKVEDGWMIRTPTPIVLQLGSDVQEIWRDNQRLHTLGEGRFLLPVGSYTVLEVQPTLQALQPGPPDSHLVSLSGDLLFQKSSQRSVTFGYRSDNRCIATLTRQPFALFVDGHETPFEALKGNGMEALVLPPGEHSVLLVTQSPVSYGVDITSFWSSYVIAIFGAVSVGLLASLYLIVRVRPRAPRLPA
ncbi:MAG TPA: DUF2334 domain-containing protein [Thermoanaerobaculaceae bacterium]|nr:DUF2334 domain-containing protein [Thermoanaerobaculaceae bacterium]